MAKKSSRRRKRANPTNPNLLPAKGWLDKFVDRTKRLLTEYVDEFTRRSQDPPKTPVVRNKVQRQLTDFSHHLSDLLAEFDAKQIELAVAWGSSGDPAFANLREAFDTLAHDGFRQNLSMIREVIARQGIIAAAPLPPEQEESFWKSVGEFATAVRTMIEACRRARQFITDLLRSEKHSSPSLQRDVLARGDRLLGEIISDMERCMDASCPYDAVREDAAAKGLVHPSVAERIAETSDSVDLYLRQLNKRLAALKDWTTKAGGAGIDTVALEADDLHAQLRSHLALDATVFTAASQLVTMAFRLPASAADKALEVTGLLDRVHAAHRVALSTLAGESGPAGELDVEEPTDDPTAVTKPYEKLDEQEKLVVRYLAAHPAIPSYTIRDLADPLADIAAGCGVRMAESTLRLVVARLVKSKWLEESRPPRTSNQQSPPFQYSLSTAAQRALADVPPSTSSERGHRHRPHSRPFDPPET